MQKNKSIYSGRDDISWLEQSNSLSLREADESEIEKLGKLKMISIRIPENVIERYKKRLLDSDFRINLIFAVF